MAVDSTSKRLVALSGMLLVLLLFVAPARGSVSRLSGSSSDRPWSGWWWPKFKGELVLGYNGHPSPVEKYDLFTAGHCPAGAYSETYQRWYDPDAVMWVGFCNGWVNAAILEKEPLASSSIGGVYFSVGDKKGLLTACHASDQIVYDYCSSNPAVFHRYLTYYIGEKREIIGADLDSSDAFWSYPIYAYEMEISERTGYDEVRCTIHYADDFVDPDFVGIEEQQATYIYTLEKDEAGDYTGNGEWLQGDPGDLHPQSVWIPIGVRPETLPVDYPTVVEIAGSRDDDLEGEELVPGHHLLVVYPGEEDSFRLTPKAGEQMVCKLALDPQSPESGDAGYEIYRGSELLEKGSLNTEFKSFDVTRLARGRELKIRLLAEGSDPGGVAVHLVFSVDSRYTSWFYTVPRTPAWIGQGVVLSQADSDARAWFEIVDPRGNAVGRGGVSGPELKTGGCWVQVVGGNVVFDRRFAEGQAIGIKLTSNYPHQGLTLVGRERTLYGAPEASSEQACSRGVIPWLTTIFHHPGTTTFYLGNSETSEIRAQISYFGKNGQSGNRTELTIPGNGIFAFDSGEYPGQSDINGWALVTCDTPLRGAAYYRDNLKTADMLPILAVRSQALVSHLALLDGWQTRLGLFNPGDEDLALTITAVAAGQPIGNPYSLPLARQSNREIEIRGELFNLSDEELGSAWLKLEGNGDFAGYYQFRFADQSRASLPLGSFGQKAEIRKLSPITVTGGWWIGLVLVNTSSDPGGREVSLAVLDVTGKVLQRRLLDLLPLERKTINVGSFFPEARPDKIAILEVDNGADLELLALYGGFYGASHLAVKSW